MPAAVKAIGREIQNALLAVLLVAKLEKLVERRVALGRP